MSTPVMPVAPVLSAGRAAMHKHKRIEHVYEHISDMSDEGVLATIG